MVKNDTNIMVTLPKAIKSTIKLDKDILISYDNFLSMISNAKKHIKISCFTFNFTVLGSETSPEGIVLFNELIKKINNGVKLTILIDYPYREPSSDINKLIDLKNKNIEIIPIKITDFYNDGVLHQKIFICDDKIAYFGSGNMSITSMLYDTELGCLTTNKEILSEVIKIFNIWYTFGTNTFNIKNSYCNFYTLKYKSPEVSLKSFKFKNFVNNCTYNNPCIANINSTKSKFCFSINPMELCFGREMDIFAMVNFINRSQRFLKLSVMDLSDTSLYPIKSDGKEVMVLDSRILDAIKRALITRKVHVQLLVSKWSHTHSISMRSMLHLKRYIQEYTTDLFYDGVGQLDIKIIKIPSVENESFDYIFNNKALQVQHAKYMVNEEGCIVSTSNYTPAYYMGTAGLSFWTDNLYLQEKLLSIYNAYWTSNYTRLL